MDEKEWDTLSQPWLGIAIRKARKESKLSMGALGERLGVSGQTVANWEHGVGPPAFDVVFRIAAVLNVPPVLFLKDMEESSEISANNAVIKETDKAYNYYKRLLMDAVGLLNKDGLRRAAETLGEMTELRRYVK